MATVRTCTLVVASTPPDALTGWGVQFYRRVLTTTPWYLHGTRDATGPTYSRSASVASGGWDLRAVWTRTGSVTIETFKTVECH